LSDAGTISPRTVEEATCLGCACLCDDIGVVVEGDRIIEARRACTRGLRWYQATDLNPWVGPMVAGRSASLDEAIDRAADLLLRARSPIVLGLEYASIEAQRTAVAIADRMGAFVSIEGANPASLASRQRVGSVGATLGEVLDRADVIVYDTLFHPRFYPRFHERFLAPPGRFVPEGRAGRTIIRLLDPALSDAAADDGDAAPDQTLNFAAMTGYSALRAILRGATIDAATVERDVGLTLDDLIGLAERLKRARYGVFVVSHYGRGSLRCEPIVDLVIELNRFTRFVMVEPGGGANTAGAASVLAWQGGAGDRVDFSMGYPRHLPGELGEADAALVLGGDVGPGRLGPGEFAAIPKVVLASGIGDLDALTDKDVLIPCAELGLDERGTVMRFDGVMIPLRPPFPARRPTRAAVLRAIAARLGEPAVAREGAKG
jgi:formylmethanofuran dehydrogenase subunit B